MLQVSRSNERQKRLNLAKIEPANRYLDQSSFVNHKKIIPRSMDPLDIKVQQINSDPQTASR